MKAKEEEAGRKGIQRKKLRIDWGEERKQRGKQ